MAAKLAILGWGSLLWEPSPDFDQRHGAWSLDGPELKLEFCRVSASRRGALTLVIDSAHGMTCRVAYALSTRNSLKDAVDDLRWREETTRKNIGFVATEGSFRQGRCSASVNTISIWTKERKLDGVVWTDLPSNFEEILAKPFTLEAGLAYLEQLDSEAKAKAVEYIDRAPAFINTPLREALRARSNPNQRAVM